MRLPGILHDDTVTILSTTTGPPDANGVPTTTTMETPWDGVNVQQVRAEDLDDQQRETASTWYRVAGNHPPVLVRAQDRIRWRGTEYLVDGEPDVRTGAYRLEHTSLQMHATTG